MRVGALLQLTLAELAAARLSVGDIEVDTPDEIAEIYFVPCLGKMFAALAEGRFDVFGLLLRLLSLSGLGGGAGGLESVLASSDSTSATSSSRDPHAHLDRVAGLSLLLRGLATPANVAALNADRKYSLTTRGGGRLGTAAAGDSLSAKAVPTCEDSASSIADVLNGFISRLAFLADASAALEDGEALVMRGVTVSSGRGMLGDAHLGSVAHAAVRAQRAAAVLECAVDHYSATSLLASAAPLAPSLFEALAAFLHTVILPLSVGSVPKSSTVPAGIVTPRHLAAAKEALGEHVMPLLFSLVEVLQRLFQGRASCGLMKLCGGEAAACWRVLAALHGGDPPLGPPSIPTSGDEGGKASRLDTLLSNPSPIFAALGCARDCASAIILLLRGSRENKKRLFTVVSSGTHFAEVAEDLSGSESDSDEAEGGGSRVAASDRPALAKIRRLKSSARVALRAQLTNAFVDYQKDSSTLLGRLLLPHPPVHFSSPHASASLGQSYAYADSGAIPLPQRGASRTASSREASQSQRAMGSYGRRGGASFPPEAQPNYFVPSLLTSCLDSYLQLQLCEIAIRARMFSVEAFQRLATFRRFDAPAVADALRAEYNTAVAAVLEACGNAAGGGDGAEGGSISAGTHTTAPVDATSLHSPFADFIRERYADPFASSSPLCCDLAAVAMDLKVANPSVFGGPLVFYEELDALLSQLPVSDASSLFSRMRDMLRDLNEFAASPVGCEAVAAAIPPLALGRLRAVRGGATHPIGLKRARSGTTADGGAEDAEWSLYTVPQLVAAQLGALNSGRGLWEVGSMAAALPYLPNNTVTFEALHTAACFTASPSPADGGTAHSLQHSSTVPFPLFGGRTVALHFASSFLVIDTPPQRLGDAEADAGPSDGVTIPFDVIRSVRLSRDRTVFVFRLDGGLLAWRAEERRRRRGQEAEERRRRQANTRRLRGGGGSEEEDDDDGSFDVENSFAAGAFDEEFSHVFNIGGAGGGNAEAEGSAPPIRGGDEDSDDDDANAALDDCVFGGSACGPRKSGGTGRVPIGLQRHIINAAARASPSMAALRRLLAPAVAAGHGTDRLPDVTLHLTVTKATMAAVMGAGVHNRIERLRGSYGLAVALARGAVAPIAAPSRHHPAAASKTAPISAGHSRHTSESAAHSRGGAGPAAVLEVAEPPTPPSAGCNEEEQPPPHVSASATRRPSAAPASAGTSASVARDRVLHMVSAVLSEESSSRQKERRLGILNTHRAQLQAYVDAFISEGRQQEELYLADVNAGLAGLRERQRAFAGTVRTAVSELNEGVDILRTVEGSLKAKLAAVEEAHTTAAHTRPLRDQEMATLVGIKALVDASVRTMEGFLQAHITGSDPLRILEAFVAGRDAAR